MIQESLVSTGQSGSAANIAEILSDAGLKFASAETKMNLYNVRLHMRLLKRFSMAVVDAANPSHTQSALYYMERNEEVFGRRTAETAMQESARALDAFQSALPDPSDLRIACENLHIVNLRGHSIKTLGRHTAEAAKALVLYNKIPQALLPRFERFSSLLTDYSSFKEFHTKYPVGRMLDGTVVETTAKPSMPIFASETMDKLMSDVLWPLFSFKKHAALSGGGGALGLPFVKDLLPQLEQMYSSEVSAATMKVQPAPTPGSAAEDMSPVTEEEAASLRRVFLKDCSGRCFVFSRVGKGRVWGRRLSLVFTTNVWFHVWLLPFPVVCPCYSNEKI